VGNTVQSSVNTDKWTHALDITHWPLCVSRDSEVTDHHWPQLTSLDLLITVCSLCRSKHFLLLS